MSILEISELLRVVSLELAPDIVGSLKNTFHVLLSNSLAFKELSISSVDLILHPLETFFKARVLARQECLVLGEDVHLSAKGLSPSLDVCLQIVSLSELVL